MIPVDGALYRGLEYVYRQKRDRSSGPAPSGSADSSTDHDPPLSSSANEDPVEVHHNGRNDAPPPGSRRPHCRGPYRQAVAYYVEGDVCCPVNAESTPDPNYDKRTGWVPWLLEREQARVYPDSDSDDNDGENNPYGSAAILNAAMRKRKRKRKRRLLQAQKKALRDGAGMNAVVVVDGQDMEERVAESTAQETSADEEPRLARIPMQNVVPVRPPTPFGKLHFLGLWLNM